MTVTMDIMCISVFSSAVLILVLVVTFSFSHSSITPKWMRS